MVHKGEYASMIRTGRMHIRSHSLNAGATSGVKARTAKNPTMPLRQSFRRLNRKSQKRLVRFSIVTANLLLIASVATAIAQSPSMPGSGNQDAAKARLAAPAEEVKPLDKMASTDVAVHISRLVSMEEATAVTNKADSASVEMAVSSSDDQVQTKPQIVTTSLKSKKDIRTYTTVEGDTVSSIATKFGVTPDTIRFSNGLSGDIVAVGKQLTISPVNGMTYVVQASDTPDSLATKYNVPKAQLIAFNDAEISGNFKVGDTIVIPGAVQPAPARTASYSSRGAVGGFSFGMSAIYGGNGYDYGWCTWHAANRRIQAGNPLPTNFGNAITWLPRAKMAGLPTGSTPRAGAVFTQKNTGALGHVGYVERVNEDGSFLASDMNYPTWGKVTYRTVPASELGNYGFIY